MEGQIEMKVQKEVNTQKSKKIEQRHDQRITTALCILLASYFIAIAMFVFFGMVEEKPIVLLYILCLTIAVIITHKQVHKRLRHCNFSWKSPTWKRINRAKAIVWAVYIVSIVFLIYALVKEPEPVRARLLLLTMIDSTFGVFTTCVVVTDLIIGRRKNKNGNSHYQVTPAMHISYNENVEGWEDPFTEDKWEMEMIAAEDEAYWRKREELEAERRRKKMIDDEISDVIFFGILDD